MIATRDPVARTAILGQQHAELAARIAAAQRSLDMIEGALECEHEDFTQCPHLRSMVAERVSSNPSQHIGV
jgi:MerR family copper efflux transcriptional regulator